MIIDVTVYVAFYISYFTYYHIINFTFIFPQGPEHSSARLERFLQLMDDDCDIIPGSSNTISRWRYFVLTEYALFCLKFRH